MKYEDGFSAKEIADIVFRFENDLTVHYSSQVLGLSPYWMRFKKPCFISFMSLERAVAELIYAGLQADQIDLILSTFEGYMAEAILSGCEFEEGTSEDDLAFHNDLYLGFIEVGFLGMGIAEYADFVIASHTAFQMGLMEARKHMPDVLTIRPEFES